MTINQMTFAKQYWTECSHKVTKMKVVHQNISKMQLKITTVINMFPEASAICPSSDPANADSSTPSVISMKKKRLLLTWTCHGPNTLCSVLSQCQSNF